MSISILLVEDDVNKKNDLIYHINSISSFGINIESVDSIDLAFFYLERNVFDLLILDLNLPNRKDGEAIDEGGVMILEALCYDESGQFKRPHYVFGISQHENLCDLYGNQFLDLSFTLNYYSPINLVWKSKLSKILEWISSTKNNSSNENIINKKIIVSVHGIRTTAKWQNKLGNIIDDCKEYEISYKPFNYGFFDLLKFLLPFTRNKQVQEFHDCVRNLVRDNFNSELYFIGHSFGTYLIGHFLKNLKLQDAVKINTVILISSVLPSNFAWHKIRDVVEINQIINDCGINDRVLLLSQSLVYGTGMSGRIGFHGIIDSKLKNRYFYAGHDLYESVENYFEKYCLPIVLGLENSEYLDFDERNRKSKLSNLTNSLFTWLNAKNITLISMFIFILILILIFI